MTSRCISKMAAVALTLTVCFYGYGCGGSGGPSTVSVSGTVTLDGEPVGDATVNFYSEEHDFLGNGVTNSEGRYTLTQGAVPGENKIWIEKIEGGPSAPAGDPGADPADTGNPEADVGQIEATVYDVEDPSQGADMPEQVIPAQYSDPAETTITFPVPEGGTDSADFRLQSQ